MSIRPTIVSPGIEVVEIDESIRASVPAGTTVYIPGFATQGPTDEVTSISSITEFEEIFGQPTNAAERYFYFTVDQVLRSNANVMVTRLPYGAGSGDTKSPQYTICAYPALGYKLDETGTAYEAMSKYSEGSSNTSYKDSATFLIGEPVQFNISLEQYYKFLNNQSIGEKEGDFDWSEDIPKQVSNSLDDLGKFALLALNVGKTVTNDNYEGYYLGLSDNAFFNPAEDYEAIKHLKTVTKNASDNQTGLTGDDYLSVPVERLDFKLNSSLKGCISQIMQESLNSFDISGNQWNDTLNFGIFKIREATNTGDALKLAALVYQGYNASLFYDRKTTSKYSTSAVDFFVENTTAENTLMSVFINPHLSGVINSRGLNLDGTPKVKVRIFSEQLIKAANGLKDEDVNTPEKLMASPYGISKNIADGLATVDSEGNVKLKDANSTFRFADALYPIGLYSVPGNKTKLIGDVPAKLSDALNLIENDELYNIDILLEAGLGSIYVGAMDNAYTAYNKGLEAAEALDEDGDTTEQDNYKELYPNGFVPDETYYDDSKIIKGVQNLRSCKSSLTQDAEQVVFNHKAVQNEFLKMATSQQEGGRGDVFFIGDIIRQIVVEGRDNKIEKMFRLPLENDVYVDEDVKHSFSTSIYWPLRHLFDNTVSSYMAVYPYFLKVQDTFNSVQFWAPSSGAVASKIAATDAKFGPWQAGAGLTNGVLSGILDISYSTNQRQRDDLYKISLNPIISSPSSGITLWGIRTMIKKNSAFDQITCRRTFLYMEKILRDTSRNFLFEGNTAFTRLQVTNTLDPIFQTIRDARGIYDYILICDNRNNDSETVDEGILRIDFYASPVRSAERILIQAHASRSGTIVTEFDQ